ncbi:hypothetical protein [Endozoicomonas lisbonensis]|uniref:Uncharacterized protein n=1 Tax=Endozoicomonas lisbonensis TaxID=3120522 RepID=A0ABV2SMZ5_9GAMM
MDATLSIPQIQVTPPSPEPGAKKPSQQPVGVEMKEDIQTTQGLRRAETYLHATAGRLFANARPLSQSTSNIVFKLNEDNEPASTIRRDSPIRKPVKRSKSDTSLKNVLLSASVAQSSKHWVKVAPSASYTNPLNPEDIHRAMDKKSLGQLATNVLHPMVTRLYECASAPLPGDTEEAREQQDNQKRFNIVRQMGVMGSMFNKHIPCELKHRKIGGGYLDFNPKTPFECIAHNIRTILMSPSSLPGRFIGVGTIKQDNQKIDFGAGDDLQASSMIVDQVADLLVNILKIAKSDDQYADKKVLIDQFRSLIKNFQACRTQGLASQECCRQMLSILQKILQYVPMIENASEVELSRLSLIERTLLAASKVPAEAEVQKALLDLVSQTFSQIQQGSCVDENLKRFEQLAEEVFLISSDSKDEIASLKQKSKQTIETMKSNYKSLQEQTYTEVSTPLNKKDWKKTVKDSLKELDKAIKAEEKAAGEKLINSETQAKEKEEQQRAEWKDKFIAYTRQININH